MTSGIPIHQVFPALHDALDTLDSLTQAARAKQEELENELNVWTGFWSGQAHEAATAWSRNVSAQLEHSIQAASNYTATARSTVNDMQAQELTNTGIWV